MLPGLLLGLMAPVALAWTLTALFEDDHDDPAPASGGPDDAGEPTGEAEDSDTPSPCGCMRSAGDTGIEVGTDAR